MKIDIGADSASSNLDGSKRVGSGSFGSASDGIHALAIVRGMRERIRELEKLARIGELAIASQKSTDCYCNESTIQPSEEDWRIDGTEERKLWNAMESDIAALRAEIDAHLSPQNTQVSRTAGN